MRLGVCSWSLQPDSPADLAAKVSACGLHALQLALDPIRQGQWPLEQTRRIVRDARIDILSGMMGTQGEDYSTLDSIRRTGGIAPDATWSDNLAAAHDNARIARELGLTLVTLHAGFIPEHARDPHRAVMLDRLRALHGAFADHGVRIALETGQEPAAAVAHLIDDLRAAVAINFDPANMILYAMGDPIAAFDALAPRVAQVHIKDALPTARPGEWGTETPLALGAVDWPAFFNLIRRRALDVNLLIERESGTTRIEDVRRAASMVREHLGAAL